MVENDSKQFSAFGSKYWFQSYEILTTYSMEAKTQYVFRKTWNVYIQRIWGCDAEKSSVKFAEIMLFKELFEVVPK